MKQEQTIKVTCQLWLTVGGSARNLYCSVFHTTTVLPSVSQQKTLCIKCRWCLYWRQQNVSRYIIWGMKVEHRRLTNRNAQSSSCSIMRQCQAFFSGCKVKTFSVMVKVSHLLPLNCVSFADRRKTPRMKQQRQRKSLRKSARLSKSLEESCPTECCSVMWGSRVKLFFSFSNWHIHF